MDWLSMYRGRRVLLTGHTGFKGGWLALWLNRLGAHVTGYALAPSTAPSLFHGAAVAEHVRHVEGDIRDLAHLERVWREVQPEIVFHLAAQALVRRSYAEPLLTVSTNVIGTANVLEIARRVDAPCALVLITSDKCYENHEWHRGYHERDELGGRDIYSASKAAADIIISGYRRSFTAPARSDGVRVASARAGNVIGGGDWSPDRIVPDSMRALFAARPIPVRNPTAVRPWQHVLEPLSGYLLLGARLLSHDRAARTTASQAWNFGPELYDSRTVADLIERVIASWGEGRVVHTPQPEAPHESGLLRLDISKAKRELGWAPRWNFETAVEKTVDWYRAAFDAGNLTDACLRQIEEYAGAEVTV
jgi:CDP-glucose 4,6-dehydratase